jgi:hypothetical protein
VSQFTRQQKLALALTSAGSQRALARQLGVSHQQVGRWLREGEPLSIDAHGNIPTNKNGSIKVFGGAPDWVAPQLDWTFEVHKAITREQCKVDRVPYNATVPVYLERRYLSSGGSDWFNTRTKAQKYAKEKHGDDWRGNYQIEFNEKIGYRVRKVGDRVISGDTEYIKGDLREKWTRGMVASGQFYKINIRSIIDLKHYFDKVADDELDSGRRRGISKKRLAYEISQAWINKEKRERGRIIDRATPFPLYTMSEDARPGNDPFQTAAAIEEMLQYKHSTATGFPGTHFADEYLLQMLPANYESNNGKPAATGRSTAKRKGTRTRK